MGEVFEQGPVRDGVFALLGVVHYLHQHAVARVASDVANDGAVVFLHRSPDESNVVAFGGFVEELGAE